MPDSEIELGRISGIFGLKGWVKVFSHTRPMEQILDYNPWLLTRNHESKPYRLLKGKRQGKTVIAYLDSIETPEAATLLGGMRISIQRVQLPKPTDNEYYWADLVGLSVQTINHVVLGKIETLIETGSNDVLVVQGDRERLIPFIQGQVIKQVDLQTGIVVVDWDLEF